MNTPPALPDLVVTDLDRLLRAVAGDTGTRTPGVLVALSGGPDSTALLRSTALWATASDGVVEAAHFNHRLRGNDADADEEFCRDLCAGLGIRLHVDGRDPRPLAAERGGGLEEASRHLRRAFCESLLATRPHLDAIATGHHRDDQIETLIMRLFRGTGPGGLAGIRPLDGRWIHPLLRADRAGILAWLESIGQGWRLDPTNVGDGNTRARLRGELLPAVRDIFGEGAEDCLLRFCALAARDDALIRNVSDAALADCRAEPDPRPGLRAGRLAGLPPAIASRLVREVLRGTGPDRPSLEEAQVARLLEWLPNSRSGGRCDLSEGWSAVREFDILRFEAPGTAARAEAVPDPAATFALSVRQATGTELGERRPEPGETPARDRSYALTCPADTLRGAPRLRAWRDGDAIVPFGMAGHRKIKEILREKRVAASDRQRVLVVEDDAGPLWIVGLMRAERTRLLPDTTAGITITVHGNRDRI